MYYLIKHPTVTNDTVLIQVPPKTVLGRWKTITIKVNNEGIAKVSPGVWNNEIKPAQDAGLVINKFLIIGERSDKPEPQSIGGTHNSGASKAGVMETPTGHKTINYSQFKEMVKEATQVNRQSGRYKDSPRPGGWT